MKTGDRIKELRKSKDLTQLELAERLNITDKAVSKWENNHGEPSIDLLLELSKLFDASNSSSEVQIFPSPTKCFNKSIKVPFPFEPLPVKANNL